MNRTLMFALFLFIASNVNAAVTDGDRDRAYRDFADDNFEFDEQTSVVCFSTFHAVQDNGQTNC